ncbi:MAG: hypothetical protein V4609_11595 [Pseudomonadota bacterium]
MERTHSTSRHGMVTRASQRQNNSPAQGAAGRGAGPATVQTSSSSSTTTSSPSLPALGRGQAPARQTITDPSPPNPTPVTERKARAEAPPLPGAGLPAVPMDEDRAPGLDRPALDRDGAQALLKKALPAHLRAEELRQACTTVYEVCVRNKLDPQSIQVLMRTMLEDHAPDVLRGAHAATNLLGLIVPIKPTMEESTQGVRHILVHMMIGVAQATARPGEPALSDAFVGSVALALAASRSSANVDSRAWSHPDGRYYPLNLARQFSIDVLSQLPASSTAAFLQPLRRLAWVMEKVADGDPFIFNNLLLMLTAGFGPPGSQVHHEHLDQVADYVLSLGLSLADAGLHLTPCMSAWAPWLPKETPRETYRRGILERMSGRPTLLPERAGQVVLATLVRHAIASRPECEALVWQYPAFGSLTRFDNLACIDRASLLVPGLSSPQQARLLCLALMASGRMAGAEELRAQLHQLVVDLALRGTDLEALSLLACAFVRGGGAKDTKSLERCVDFAPPAPRQDAKMEASSSTTTTSVTTTGPSTSSASSSPAQDKPAARDARELVQALRRGGVLAGAPLKALAMADLGWPRRLALLDGALAIGAPLPDADARALVRQLEPAACTDVVKAQALQLILRHAGRDFAGTGQKALWALLAQDSPANQPVAGRDPKAEVAMEDDVDDTDDRPALDTKASGPAPAGKQFLFAKDAPLDVLKVAYDVVREDGNRAWDAVEKARALPLAHDRRPLLEMLDATLARLAAAEKAAGKSKDPRAQQLVKEAKGWIQTLSQARRPFMPPAMKD